MIGNRKALQRRIVKLEDAIRMREAGNARVIVLHGSGHYDIDDAEDSAAWEADIAAARAAWEEENGPIKDVDTVITVRFVAPRAERRKEAPEHGSTPAPHDAHEDAPGGEDHPAPQPSAAPPAPEPRPRAPLRDPYREWHDDLKRYF